MRQLTAGKLSNKGVSKFMFQHVGESGVSEFRPLTGIRSLPSLIAPVQEGRE